MDYNKVLQCLPASNRLITEINTKLFFFLTSPNSHSIKKVYLLRNNSLIKASFHFVCISHNKYKCMHSFDVLNSHNHLSH